MAAELLAKVPTLVLLLSAMLGAGGTVLLSRGSFAYESVPFYDDNDNSYSKAIGKRNAARQRQQRFGLTLLLLSFVFQAAGILLSW